MSAEPLVSVIMPFFNTPLPFMQEAVASVLAQTYSRWELLLVDDGSADASTGLAKNYAAQHPGRIQYFEHAGHQNRGASASRNLAIHHARGDYIALLDADDIWLPYKLEQQAAILTAHPRAVMLYGNTEYWYSWTGRPADARRDFMPALGVRPNMLIEPPGLLPLYLRGKAAVPCTCSVMLRREWFDRGGRLEDAFPNLYDDQVLYAKVCLTSAVFVAANCWDKYRQRSDSTCSVAEQDGLTRTARLSFLYWLEGYLAEQEVDNAAIWQVLRKEIQRCDRSGSLDVADMAEYLVRRTRKVLNRMTKLL